MEIPFVRSLVARILGITDQRPFPKFSSGRAKLIATESRGHRERIIYLSDPFSRYIEPQVEQAAFDILSKCGYQVHVLPMLGAGASFLSKGFIEEARHRAEKVLDALKQIDPEGGAAIVGIEPPEIYCLKHDYVDLLPAREDEIHRRMDHVWLLDEYLLRSEGFNLLRVVTMAGSFSSEGFVAKKIRFHPHCHQRAEGLSADGLPTGTSATVELLRSCGFDVELMDTGCCGMAGTFGYEAEHYELSMKVGELKLFPQLRAPTVLAGTSPKSENEPPLANVTRQFGFGGGGEGVVSSGAACRMQIEQGTGIKAIHPIVLVADLLQERSPHGKE